MITMTNFFLWFFYGLNGIGGWLVFMGLGLLCTIILWVNSFSRKLPAKGWRLASLLIMLLILPAAVRIFLPVDMQAEFAPYLEYIFYAGVMAGVLPLVMLISYGLQYRGMQVCPEGHLYTSDLAECPLCIPEHFVEYDPSELDETQLDQLDPIALDETTDMTDGADTAIGETMGADTEMIDQTEVIEREFFETQFGKIGMPEKFAPKANGFLLFSDGHSLQLNQGATTIGRSSSNDCAIQNGLVSRSHAKIIEESPNLFRLYDLGSANGTWLNGRKLIKATLLENDDQIRFGDEVMVVFLSSRKM